MRRAEPGSAAAPPPDGLEVSVDAFLGGALRLMQPRAAYRAGVDAICLAASVPDGGGRPIQVLDVGAGVGAAGLAMARRCPNAEVVLIEREPALAELAVRNAADNGLAARTRVICLDIAAPAPEITAAGLMPDSFDHVIANPPYHAPGRGTAAASDLKAAAHAMPAADLDRWVRFIARFCAPRGSAILIHKAEELGALLAAMAGRFGGLRVLPLSPRAGAPAIRVIVQGFKGSRAPLTLLAPFVLHGPDGNAFTAEADAVLRAGAPLAVMTEGM